MSIDPCSTCGAPARIKQGDAPRRLGEKVARTTEVRVCSNPDCSTNNPRTRRLGDTV